MRNLAIGTAGALLVCIAASPALAERKTNDTQRAAHARPTIHRGTQMVGRHDSRSHGDRYRGHSQSFRSSYSRYYGGYGHSPGCGCGHCRTVVVVPSPGYRHYPSYRAYPSGYRSYHGDHGYRGYRSYHSGGGVQYNGRGFSISIGF